MYRGVDEGINVLSLFDGMSCGRIALERARVRVNTYYSSEIEENAIIVSQANYPNIIRLGDVTEWREWDIDWSSIDLLIGGSPCTGFSVAGKQLNFEDPQSKLFFEYVDILNHIKAFNPNVDFLLENVKMKKDYMEIISDYLKVDPILINSSKVSAQLRSRYYWTSWEVDQPKDRGITLQSILEDGITDRNKAFCLTLHRGNVRDYFKKHQTNIAYLPNADGLYEVKDGLISMTFARGKDPNEVFTFRTNVADGRYNFRPLTPNECETLQTVPNGYTSMVGITARSDMLGNGWTVDVIAHLFSHLKQNISKE